MMKDTFFSLSRFTNLCRKEIVENWKSNFLRVVVVYGVMTVVMVWNGYFKYQNHYNADKDYAWSFLLVFFMASLWIFGCLSASFTMEKLKTKTSRIAMLMLPATPFEKFFSRWLMSTVVFLFVFLVCYKLADYTRVLIFTLAYPGNRFIAPVDLSHLVGDADYYTLFRTHLEFGAMLAGYFFVQSLFVLGSSIWPKNSFVKAYSAIAITVVVYVSVATLLIRSLMPNQNLMLMSHTELLSTMLVGEILFTLVNWILAYMRFKESEIINRM